jgi:Lysozyme inhibitor LprI
MKCLAFALLIVSLPVLAQDSAQYSACNEKAKTQMEMNACASEEAARADADLNDVYRKVLAQAGKLDLGCIAAHGMFSCDENRCYALSPQGRPAMAFLFELIARLQMLATVPMIDVRAYARWLVD